MSFIENRAITFVFFPLPPEDFNESLFLLERGRIVEDRLVLELVEFDVEYVVVAVTLVVTHPSLCLCLVQVQDTVLMLPQLLNVHLAEVLQVVALLHLSNDLRFFFLCTILILYRASSPFLTLIRNYSQVFIEMLFLLDVFPNFFFLMKLQTAC